MTLASRSPADIARILSHSRLFYGLPPAALFDLISHSRVEDIRPGLNEITEIRANELRIVLEGDLRFISDGTVLGRGNFFGETALLDHALAQELDSVGVQSNAGCTTLVITAHELTEWLERHPRLQARIYQHLSQELFNRCLGAETEATARFMERTLRKAG